MGVYGDVNARCCAAAGTSSPPTHETKATVGALEAYDKKINIKLGSPNPSDLTESDSDGGDGTVSASRPRGRRQITIGYC